MKKVLSTVFMAVGAIVFYPIITVIDLVTGGFVYLNKGIRECWLWINDRVINDTYSSELLRQTTYAIINEAYKDKVDELYSIPETEL